MLKFPLIKRKTPIVDFLKARPTIFLKEPLVKKVLGGGEFWRVYPTRW